MKKMRNRMVSTLLVIALIMTFASMMPLNAVAAGNYVVSLTGVGLDNNQAEIQDALDDEAANYDSVTVIGSASFRDTLNIRIPAGKKVVWQAELDSTAVARAINITGAGDFEIVSGGVIKSASSYAIYVSKGNISITGTGRVEAGAGTGFAITIVEEGVVTMSQWASVTSVGNAISNAGGIVLLSENAKVTGAVCIRAYSVIISGGSIVSTGVEETAAVVSEKGLITVTGGSVTSASVDGVALKSSQGSVTVSGGTVAAAGLGGIAIHGVQSTINIVGGSVLAAGDNGFAVYCAEGVLSVSGGVVAASGETDEGKLVAALLMGPGGVACVTGGEVKSTAAESYAIAAVSYGAAVYLKGIIVAGEFFVDNSAAGFAQGDNGTIVEVDTLSVPISRNGGNEGLARKAGGGAAVWDMSGANPKISILLPNGVKREIEWGAKYTAIDIQLEDMNYVRGYGINLLTVVAKDFSLFRNVRVDGVSIMRDADYRAEESSTKITLFAEYLDTLSDGKHSLAIGFTDGSTANASITVKTIWTNPFTDVPADIWYFNDLRTACQLGLINGKTPTTFAPAEFLTYAEAVKLAACMHQLYTTGDISLTNADAPDPWYQTYVDYCKALKIINADYEWGDVATRAGYIEIFAAALPNEAFTVINQVANGAIPDIDMEHPQAAAIYKLYRAGIVEGSDAAHNFRPDTNIVRRDVAVILTRMMDDSARKTFTLSGN
ncbi:MAG: S-layer homology domain-containing protein [Oscillospiraceae bacterium]|nr:S-layer homology domain-containing protein [Oscillospiraceae bacterium]